MESFGKPIRAFRRSEWGFSLGAGLWAAGLLLSFTSLLPAEDFRLRYLDAEPISLHATLSYEGKGERLTATAKNESSATLRHAKICIPVGRSTEGVPLPTLELRSMGASHRIALGSHHDSESSHTRVHCIPDRVGNQRSPRRI